MKETLASIAAKAGCSPATVSRVLNGVAERNRITRETADKIISVLQESGYVPNRRAKKARKNSAGSIGLLLPSVSNPYFSEMAGVIIEEAYPIGYKVIMMDAQEDSDRFADCLNHLESESVSGIIAVPCGENAAILEKVSRIIPLVLLDRFYRNMDIPYVTCNNYQGGYDACHLLLSAGCRRIAAIQGPETSISSTERVRGYREAMASAGLSDSCIVVGSDFSQRCGYIETKCLLSGGNCPDAIFALSNTIMLGAVQAIREAHLSIPEDISIVSFDDCAYMDYMDPAITRVEQPVRDIASLALKLLNDRIRGVSDYVSKITLSPKLVVRESVRKK